MTDRFIRCDRCQHVDLKSRFKPGRGRAYWQHPEHDYCPRCGSSITWFGATYAREGEQGAAGVES